MDLDGGASSTLVRYRDIIDEWDTFADFATRALPHCFWVNTLKITEEALLARLHADGILTEPLSWLRGAHRLLSDLPLGKRFEHLTGLIYIQEEVSMLPVAIMDPQPGERVLDMCAAPGSKTSQIGIRMQNRGTIVANDASYPRMRSFRRNQERLGIVNMTLTCRNGFDLPMAWGPFDRVLADVPCSCEGNSRKSLTALTRKEPGFREGLTRTQTKILRRALRLVKPGGVVVYSTCTYAPEENEGVLDTILRESEGSVRIIPLQAKGGDPQIVLPNLKTASGLSKWGGQVFHPDVSGAVRLYPHLNDTGGFFIAALRRVEEK